ncbi:MAG: GDYXXLXY domain-containing protein [Acidobacteriota bacterium]
MLNNSKKMLTAALVLPFVLMLAVTVPYIYLLIYGQEVSLLIEGYDPHDLLRGNYVNLTYVTGDGDNINYMDRKYITFTNIGKYYVVSESTDEEMNGGVYFKTEKIPREFFVMEKDAKRIERELRTDRKYVAVFQYKDGRGFIKDIRPVD